MASKKSCEDCGYDPANKRHEMSYWEGSADPRDRSDDDKYMMFTSNYYKVVDRQIAENHQTECLGKSVNNGNGANGSTSAKK